MTDVFISYSRRDKIFTQKLVEALQAAKREVWADWASIPAASDWDAEIKEGIEKTNIVLFVLSPEWIKSNECRKEMNHAVKMGKQLVPILHIMPGEGHEVPPELAKLNWVYMRESDEFDKVFQTLLNAMDTDLDWIKTHTRIQVRALEWEKKNRSSSFALRGEDLTEGERFIARGAEKTPAPTHLQSEYILASRKDATQRQRQTLAAVTVALVVSVALGAIALLQRQTAQANLVVAQTAQVLADNNAATAVANEKEAIRQAKLSRAGELAAQSESLMNGDFQLSLLLGIEAYKVVEELSIPFPVRNTLLNNNLANPQLEQYLNEHSGSVSSVAFSPDGVTLASGGVDGLIILWNSETGRPIGELSNTASVPVSAVDFSPDGTMLASGYADGTIILWNVETRQPIGESLSGHLNNISSIAFSSDGKMLGSGSTDGTIMLWDTETHQNLHGFGTEDSVNSVAFSQDGKRLASGGIGGTTLWDVETGQSIEHPPSGRTLSVNSVAFSPDGRTLASGGDDGLIYLWDMEEQQPVGQPLDGRSGRILSVTFGSDGQALVSGDANGIILLWQWNVQTNNYLQRPLHGHTKAVLSLALSPDATMLVSGSADETIILWERDVTTRQPIGETLYRGYPDYVYGFTFSTDSKTLAANQGGIVNLWDLDTNQLIGEPLQGNSGTLSAVTFDPTGKTLASGSSDGSIILWDIETRQPMGEPLIGHTDYVSGLAFKTDGKTLASGSNDETVILWDIVTRQPLGQPLSAHTDYISSVAFSPDGKTLASGSGDGTIILWNVETRQPLDEPFIGHTDYVSSVAFSPDGKTLASGSGDRTIILWNAETRQPIGKPLNGHRDFVSSVAFSPDGKTLASGSGDGTIILWDIATRQPIGQPLSGHYIDFSTMSIYDEEAFIGLEDVSSVAFSPNGKTLVSGSMDSIILWHVSPLLWIEKSCQRVGRNLTRVEWAQYFPNEEYRKTCEQWDLEAEPTLTPIATP